MPWRGKRILIALVIILAIILVAMVLWFIKPPVHDDVPDRFITANPFDLTQIAGFSQYRSCEGHDYRAPTVAGEMEQTPRSMKHYVAVKPEYRGTTGAVDVFAPFDGEITEIMDEASSPDKQVWLTPNPKTTNQWQFIFFHIILDTGLKKGARITAGQHIGTAHLARGPDGATDNFDIALKLTHPLQRPAVEPPFNHMARNVLDEYAQYGINASDLIISKEERDNDPCPIAADERGRDDYVWLNTN